MNTVLADVPPLNANVNDSVHRSEINNDGAKGDKFSKAFAREMSHDRELPTQAEYPQVIDNKEQKLSSGESLQVASGLVNDIGASVTWLQHLADQELGITTEVPVEPVDVVIDEALLSSITDANGNGNTNINTNTNANEVPLMHIGLVPSGETLPVGGKPLPPGSIQASLQSVISMPAMGTDDQSAQSDLSRQPKLLQPVADADEAFAIKTNGLGEATQIKTNDFQMMQSAMSEVVELNGSQARLQNPSAVISVGSNSLNNLLLPTELETLTVNNTRDTTAWGNGVGERVHWMINQKLNTATIRLDPPSLGRLEVNIQVSDDVTKVTINTQHAQTRDIIDNASFKLREFLQENGYQNVSVDVSHQEQQQQASQQTGRDSAESLTDDQLNQEIEGMSGNRDTRHFSSDSVVDYFV